MFESIICAVQLAVNKKEAGKCIKWNKKTNENGLTNGTATGALAAEGSVAPIRGFISLWTCLTDCGSMEESREGGAIGKIIDTGAGGNGYIIPEVGSPDVAFDKNTDSHWDLTSNESVSSFAKKSNYNSPVCLAYNGGEIEDKNVHYYKQNFSGNKYAMVENNSQDS